MIQQNEILLSDNWWGNWLLTAILLFSASPFVVFAFKGFRNMIKRGNFFAILLIVPIALLLDYIFVSLSFPSNLFVIAGILFLATLAKVHERIKEEYTTTLLSLAFALGFMYFPFIRQGKIICSIELINEQTITLNNIYGNAIDSFDLLAMDSVTSDKTFVHGRTGGPHARYELNLFAKGKKYTSAKFEYNEINGAYTRILDLIASKGLHIEGRWHLFLVSKNNTAAHAFRSGAPICHIDDLNYQEDLSLNEKGEIETDCVMLSPLNATMKGTYHLTEDKKRISINYTDSVVFYRHYFPLSTPLNIEWFIEKLGNDEMIVSEKRDSALFEFRFYRLKKKKRK